MKQKKVKIDLKAAIAAVLFASPLTIMNAEASFSDIGLGARSAAMGTAFSAVSNDANAMNTNPAGLATLTAPELAAVYGKLHTGLSDDSRIGQGYFGVAAPVKRYAPGFMGFSWDETRLSEAYSETVFTVAYATSVYRNLYGGVNLKYLRKGYTSDVYTEADPLFAGKGYSKSGFAADIGALYRLNSSYTFGLVVKNINQPDMGLGSRDIVPMQVKAGAAYWLRNGLVDLDLSFRDRGCDAAIGAERVIQQKFIFRAGFLAGSDSRRNISLGFGSRFGGLNFDYAFTLPVGGIASTTGSHRLAFGFKFGGDNGMPEAEDIRTVRERLAGQERQIRALEEKIKARDGDVKIPAAASVTPVTTAPAAAPDAGIEKLKAELEESRKEADNFKNRLISLEEKSRKPAPARPGLKDQEAGKRVEVYVVQAGDTLESIARKVYGDASKWPLIYKANAASVGRGGEVRPGAALVIP